MRSLGNDVTLRTRQSAFTLIELLVVVAIIALLISILLPSLSRAREQARRVVCGTQIRGYVMVMLTYADEYNGYLADPGNNRQKPGDNKGMFSDYKLRDSDLFSRMRNNPANNKNAKGRYQLQWCHPAFREIMFEQFQLKREFFYCPSEDDNNTDANWEVIDTDSAGRNSAASEFGQFVMTGYMYIAGRPELSTNYRPFEPNPLNPMAYRRAQIDAHLLQTDEQGEGIFDGGFESAPVDKQLFKRKVSDKSWSTVAMADLTRTATDQLAFDTIQAKSNHISAKAANADLTIPGGQGGANVGHTDGHVEWVQQAQLGGPKVRRGVFQVSDGFRWAEYREDRYWW